MADYPGLNEDFVDLLAAFRAEQVEFLVVGAHAMAAHGVPRATGDLDLFVRPTPENAGVTAADLTVSGTAYPMGLPPRRIDLLTSISGVTFDEAHTGRITCELDGLALDVIGRDALIANERAAARDKDLVDAKLLERRREDL